MPQIIYSNTAPRFHDTKLIALQKILQQLNTTGSSGGATASVSGGDADPVADPGVDYAIYYNRTTGVIWQWNDTAGAWE